MMNKIKSSKIAKLKLFAIIPVLTILFLAFSCNKVGEVSNETSLKKEKLMYVVDGKIVNNIDNIEESSIESKIVVKANDKTAILDFGEKAKNGVIIIRTNKFENKLIDNNGDTTFMIVEEMPIFPGGDLELRKFIATNVKYPAEARESDIQGKVYVRFIVSADGSVKDVTIARGVDKMLDDEAIRVVSMLPKWKPGKQGGKAVDVYFTVPINFAIQ